MQVCPRGGEEMLKGFAEFCTQGQRKSHCNACLSGLDSENIPK
jgi:DtxR family Mn-dependent transcriptional regulator